MKKWHYPFLAFLIIGTFIILSENRNSESGSGNGKASYRTASGLVFGTNYHATYLSDTDLQPEIENALAQVDKAPSAIRISREQPQQDTGMIRSSESGYSVSSRSV